MKLKLLILVFLSLFALNLDLAKATTSDLQDTRDLTLQIWSEKLHGGKLNKNKFFIENRFQNKPLSYDYLLLALATKSGDISCIKRNQPLQDFEALCLQERFKVGSYSWGKRMQTVPRKVYLEKFNFGTVYTQVGAPKLLDALNGFFAGKINEDSKLTEEEIKVPVDTTIKKETLSLTNEMYGASLKYSSNFEKIGIDNLPKQFYSDGKFIGAFIPKDNIDSLDKDYVTVYLYEFDEDDGIATLTNVRDKVIKDTRFKDLSKFMNINGVKTLEFIDKSFSDLRKPFTHAVYIINDSRVLKFTYFGLNHNSRYYSEFYDFITSAKIKSKADITYGSDTFDDTKIGVNFEYPDNFVVEKVSSVDNLTKNNPYLYYLNPIARQYEVFNIKPWYKDGLRTYPLVVTTEKDINVSFDQTAYLEDLKIALNLYNNVKITKEGAYYSGKTKMYELQYTLTNKLNSSLSFDIIHRIVASNFKIVSIIKATPKTAKVDFKKEFETITKTLKIK